MAGRRVRVSVLVNDAFGTAKETVRLTVQTAVGEVDLEVAP